MAPQPLAQDHLAVDVDPPARIMRDLPDHSVGIGNAYYLIRAEESGPRACVCIQLDDAEKLRALVTARGIDLGLPSD